MAYHKWDAEYWQGEYQTLVQIRKDLQIHISELNQKLRIAEERAKLFDTASRPILFIQENSIQSLPDVMRLMYTIVEYKSGYNKPEMVTANNPYKL